MATKAKQLQAKLNTLYAVKRMLTNRIALNANYGKVEIGVQEHLDAIDTEIAELTKAGS